MSLLVLTTSCPADAHDYRGRFVLDLARALVDRGHAVTLMTPHPGREAPRLEQHGRLTILRVPYARAGNAAGPSLFGRFGLAPTLRSEPWRMPELALALPALTAAAARIGPLRAVISNWLIPCGLIGAALAARRGLPHIVVEHGGGARLLTALPGGTRLAAAILSRATLAHFVSAAAAQAIVELLPPTDRAALQARLVISPMPLPGPLPPLPERSFAAPLRLLFVGRLVPGKGVELLLEALGSCPQIQATLVGDGPQRPAASAAVDRLGLADRVTLTGERPWPELASLCASHDLLAIPSTAPPSSARGGRLAEGVPRILLEGMSHGLVPVVSTAGGMAEIVADGHNGMHFPAGNARTLAAILNHLAANPAHCRRLSRAAHLSAAQFTSERFLELWLPHLPLGRLG